ncbi:YfhO family protein [Staphylococcus sp. H16/1A]|uniref:YfhO family protein n=2 Tax=Staphylococcus canis TaxID=2724942 RepID=A0ABS0T834_9STAP|nr:YfhO family protein [Staphylococcus canis]
MALAVGAIVYIPVLYRFLIDGIIYSGNGDGFKQMMPFQMFLYEHFSQMYSLYDVSFGLGGDYFTDLAYYYATSPIMYLNFLFVALSEGLLHTDPSHIEFWPGNQIFIAYIKCVIVFLVTYGMLREFKLRGKSRFLGAFLYSASTVLYYFNFTWSFFGDIMIYLPLSIWGMERFFKRGKIGLFIFSIAITLFSNFYFSYYEMIGLSAYLVYRLIFKHPDDIVKRIHKLLFLIPAAIISLCIGSFGFLTGVKSFLNNDRQSNDVFISPIIDFSQKYHIFTNGFYITLSFVVLVALFSFKLYRYYAFKMFAILTWILLIASFSPYFDSLFNGFSFPQRRWVYILALTSSILIALWFKHLSELTWKDYRLSILPVIVLLILTAFTSRGAMWWMIASILILIVIGFYIYQQHSFMKPISNVIVGLFVIQQFVLLINYHHNNIAPYQSKLSDMHAPDYHSPKLQQDMNQIKKQQQPLERIDYMSSYAVNSAMIYHYNGLALYSSIFDGAILNYYDKLMQINMEYDSNSTYRLLGDRANLYALWGVTDRIKEKPDTLLPYGMKHVGTIQDNTTRLDHSKNTIEYPSAHLTSKVFHPDQLKSPLDREQAMLQGVVSDAFSSNQSFQPNKNLLNQTTITTHHAKRFGNKLNVLEDDGGLEIHIPKRYQQKYKDLYLEMDIELLAPNQPHYLKVNDFYQRRTKLDYAYRRFITPVTIRVPIDETMRIQLKKGTYRAQLKGLYGENYQTLQTAKKEVTPVKMVTTKNSIKASVTPKAKSYLVLPIPYRDGLVAYVDQKPRPVQKGNGLMSVIPVNKGDSNVVIKYHIPQFWLFIGITIFGIIAALIYRRFLYQKLMKSSQKLK